MLEIVLGANYFMAIKKSTDRKHIFVDPIKS